MTTDHELGIIRAGFDEMNRLEIVIAPWMVRGGPGERLTKAQANMLRALARDLSIVYSRGELLWLETDGGVPQFYREHAYYETLLSTAAYLSHMRLGTLVITDEMVSVAYSLVKDYVKRDGGAVLISVYARVMTYLNSQLLDYYGQVPEDVFVSGEWHRPWIDRRLTEEMQFGIERGLFVRKQRDGATFVELTEKGRELYVECANDLETCGYQRQREQLIRASNFTTMDDYEQLVEQHTPDIHGARRRLIEWSGVQCGMKVLELGCGAGALTFNDGLYKVVGETGKILATDPAIGMLSRANEKKRKYNASNVRLLQGSAEKIPAGDNTFDVVIGSLFLHFTDIPRALAEIHRVLKPGGVFATLYSLDIVRADFLSEWFQPLFTRGLVSRSKSIMPAEDTVMEMADAWFSDIECSTDVWKVDCSPIENVVRFFVQAGTMAELNELPWRARNELFDELVSRGYQVKVKYGPEAMYLKQPEQWFRGVAKK